jgi:hypothetical protein
VLFQLNLWVPEPGKFIAQAQLLLSALEIRTDVTLTLHRLLTDWGEGSSTEANPIATDNDATCVFCWQCPCCRACVVTGDTCATGGH